MGNDIERKIPPINSPELLAANLDVCESHLDKQDYQNAEEIVERAERAIAVIDDRESEEFGRYLYLKGSVLLEKHQSAKAEQCLTMSEEIFLKLQNERYLGLVYNKLGRLEHALGQYQMAIRLFTSSINYSKKAGNKIAVIQTYNNCGVTKRHLHHFDNALQDFQMAEELSKKNKYDDVLGGVYSNIGAVYGMQNNPEKAIEYQEKAVRILKKNEGKYRISMALNNLGRTYLLNNQLEEALMCYEEVKLSMDGSEEYMENLMLLNLNFGIFFTRKKDLDKALEYFNQAEVVANAVGTLANKKSIYLNLANIHEELENHKEALEYFKKFYEIHHKIIEENTKDSINQLVAKFELKQQRRERETYKILNRELERSNRDLERFAYIASHDLKEPLRMVNTYLSLIEKRYGHLLDTNGHEFIRFAVDGGTRMNQLLDGLLNYSRVTTRAKEFEPTPLQDVIEFVLKNLTLVIKETNAVINYPKTLPVISCDQAQIIQLFQNIISNSLKFQKEGEAPLINIRVSETEENYHFEFEDNGIGIDPKYHDKVFEILTRVHSRSQFEGSGIGLSIVRKIVQRHKGQVKLVSQVDEGTSMYIDIPKSQ